MMFVLIPPAVVVIAWVVYKIRLRRARILTPLAGLDTGVRSAFRAPRGLFNNKRGF